MFGALAQPIRGVAFAANRKNPEKGLSFAHGLGDLSVTDNQIRDHLVSLTRQANWFRDVVPGTADQDAPADFTLLIDMEVHRWSFIRHVSRSNTGETGNHLGRLDTRLKARLVDGNGVTLAEAVGERVGEYTYVYPVDLLERDGPSERQLRGALIGALNRIAATWKNG